MLLAGFVDVPLVVRVNVQINLVQVTHIRHAVRQLLRLDEAKIDTTIVEHLVGNKLFHHDVVCLGAEDHFARRKAAVLDHRALDRAKVGKNVLCRYVSGVPLLRESRRRLFAFTDAAPEVDHFVVSLALYSHLAGEERFGAHGFFATRDDVVELRKIAAEDFGSTFARRLAGVDRLARKALEHVFSSRDAHRREFRRFEAVRRIAFALEHDAADLRVDERSDLAAAHANDVEINLLRVERRAISEVAIAKPSVIRLLTGLNHAQHGAGSKHIHSVFLLRWPA